MLHKWNPPTYQTLPTFRSYPSYIKLVRRSQEKKIWAIGTEVILKECPRQWHGATPFDEAAVLEFVKENTSIPVPAPMTEWSDSNEINFILLEMVQGESLDKLWPGMSWKEKERIADQTAGYLCQLRNVTAPYLGRVDKEPLVDQWLFNTLHPLGHGPFDTVDELWETMIGTVDHIPRWAFDQLRLQMPEAHPFTFTHGDLSLDNIIIKDGNVVGLIDWEWSGFFPVWWEYAKLRCKISKSMDPDWSELLEPRLDRYSEAFRFMQKFRKLVDLSVELSVAKKPVDAQIEELLNG